MTLPAAAAAKKKKSKKPPQPIEIVADEMYFSDKTGELFARGNVVITQDKSKIYADIVRGNDKQTEMWVDGKARLIEPRTDLVGIKIRYNYGAKFGAMQEIKGQCGDDFISASKIHFENGKYTAYNATTTGCPAKGKPDYRVTAKKVVIWPEDKMIAYDAKIWIKDFVVYTTPKYVKSLKKGDKEDEFPSFGYQDPDGFWIKQHLRYPVTDSVSFATDLYYFTNKGFKPTFELLQEKSDYSFKISAGDYSSTNSSPDQIFGGTSSSVNWVTKAPEFEFKWNEKQIGQFPWRYRFSALIGRWTDAVKTSWHHDYLLYFTRDPIYFDKAKTWTWNNGFGLEQVRESYDNSVQNIIRYNSSLAKRISPRVTVWAAYNYTNNNQSAFAYNSINVAQEWVTGIYVQLDKKTGISYSNSYDIVNGRTYENYYTIYRNMHCWNTYIQYQEKQKKWVWNIAVVRF
jgi:LPS-assembly protein